MALSRSRLRSELPNSVERKRLLDKITALMAQSKRHVVIEKGSFRSNASLLDSIVIDTSTANVITFTRKSGDDPEAYLVTDIQIIRRLRTKKWMIEIKATAVSQ